MHRVFVYGTLKRGFCRDYALSNQKFLGPAATTPHYRLFDLGSYPGLVQDNNGLSIPGELNEVDDGCLEKLDAIEGVDQGLYCREEVLLLPPWDDKPALTYIYLRSIEGHAEIGSWQS